MLDITEYIIQYDILQVTSMLSFALPALTTPFKYDVQD